MSIIQPDTTYNIIENLLSQNAIKFPDSLDDNAVDKIISIASTGLSLKRDILTTAVETIITPLDITDVTTGNVITMARLCYLPTGLFALTIPTVGGTTCNFNDAIQLQDYNNTPSPPVTHSEVTIGSNPSTLFGMNIHTTTATPFAITGDGDITISADDSISLTSVGLGNINLDAPNINSYTYAMPICFTRERADNFNYSLGGQTFQNVYSTAFNVPFQFFSDTPQFGYTSSYWKIDFALNCYTNSATADKGIAIYFEFLDGASNSYSPIAYNQSTPYAVYQPASTFVGGTSPPYQNFNWTDVIDFAGLSGTGSGNVPLNINLWFAGDNPLTCNFQMVMTLTRTNVV